MILPVCCGKAAAWQTQPHTLIEMMGMDKPEEMTGESVAEKNRRCIPLIIECVKGDECQEVFYGHYQNM